MNNEAAGAAESNFRIVSTRRSAAGRWTHRLLGTCATLVDALALAHAKHTAGTTMANPGEAPALDVPPRGHHSYAEAASGVS